MSSVIRGMNVENRIQKKAYPHQPTPVSMSTKQESLNVLTAKVRSHVMIWFSTPAWQHFMRTHLIFGDHNDPLRSFQDHADAHVDAKLAEIAFHRATVESYLTFWGRLHLPLRALLQCQFWDGWKFGNLPRWVWSCLKEEPTQSWKFPLHSCEPSDLVPTEHEPSKGGLGVLRTLGIQSGDERQKGDFKTPICFIMFRANIVVFLVSFKKTLALESLSHGLFKFDASTFRTENVCPCPWLVMTIGHSFSWHFSWPQPGLKSGKMI